MASRQIICTLYAHDFGFDKIVELIKSTYPEWGLSIANDGESDIINIDIKNGFLKGNTKLRVNYRERKETSAQLPAIDDCPLTKNIRGLYGYVRSLPTSNEKVKQLFLTKIVSLNSEFSISLESGKATSLEGLVKYLAKEFNAVLFAQPGTVVSRSQGQHFLDENLNLIIDGQGNCDIDTLDVKINSSYVDSSLTEASQEQLDRKERNEKDIAARGIKVNKHLPCVESEKETSIRPAIEIVHRVGILTITNQVAFDTMTNDDAIDFLKSNRLWDFATPSEKTFLMNPSSEQRIRETWKCEAIWVLMWALKKIDQIGFPDVLCDLNNIPSGEYPFRGNVNPQDFTKLASELRGASEILNANDLYYRLDWACVDARINNTLITEVNPAVVYERHYALNWLINYMNQDWDDVTCDT